MLTKMANNNKNGRFLPEWDEADYLVWREEKLHHAKTGIAHEMVQISDLNYPNRETVDEILTICRRMNFAFYELAHPNDYDDPQDLRRGLNNFCRSLGLKNAEQHRSAGDQGIVALEVSNQGVGSGYIPYTDKPLSWHTDGYYNQKGDEINAMVLHCARDAMDGGNNQILDPEIAYIRLRDKNPHYIAALMHPEAMTIPENTDSRTDYRPASIGPVFRIDSATGALNMRYTSRTRSIVWRDDETTRQACAFLTGILSNDPLIVERKLKSGQGIISNNVLHNRTRFFDSQEAGAKRLMYRIRYKERIALNSAAV